MPEPRVMKISQSEVSTYLACEKKHQFAFLNKLEPRQQSQGITKGNAGHAFFESFLTNGEDFDTAVLKMIESDPQSAATLIPRLKYWVEFVYPGLGWKNKILVEETINLDVTYLEDINVQLVFPFTADLVVETTNGDTVLVDHKFLADPYSDETVAVAKQLPLYIGALRASGYPVKHAMYNIIRTRSNATEFCLQKKVEPDDLQITTQFNDHVVMMERIARAKLKAEEAGKAEAIRTADPLICKWCPFAQLCKQGMSGTGKVDPLTVKMNFQRNSYGY